MVRDRWQFTAPPFAGTLEPATFHCGGPQEEALARLEWLVGQRQRFALVTGAEGMGKSHLAAMAVRRLAGLGAETALLSLRGLAAGEWIDLLLARLPLDPLSRAEPLRPWQKLEDRLRENTLMERPTALIVDDLDHAAADAIDGVARIVGAGEPLYAKTVVVATTPPAGMHRITGSMRGRAAVRVELGPWGDDDVAAFIAAALRRVGGAPDLFSPDAIGTITRFARGVPRGVCQLAHLATVAAEGEGLDRIDASVIESVWRELAPMSLDRHADDSSSGGAEAVERHAAEEPAPPHPRVRAVRKLWG
ncbi:MAG: hypothetical protein ACKOEX_00815 [Planctomycetia bacterium]